MLTCGRQGRKLRWLRQTISDPEATGGCTRDRIRECQDVSGDAGSSGGDVAFDTSWITFSPAPAAGEKFRMKVSASYTGDDGNPVQITEVDSEDLTPIP
jgi:hypothetical protein